MTKKKKWMLCLVFLCVLGGILFKAYAQTTERISPFYFQNEGDWYQCSQKGQATTVSFPECFEPITVLQKENQNVWVGISQTNDKQRELVEFAGNEFHLICTEQQMKEHGIELDLICHLQYRPKGKELCFKYENSVYVCDAQEGIVELLHQNVKDTYEYSYLWIDEEQLLYIDKNTQNICGYHCKTKETKIYPQMAYRLFAWDEESEKVYFLYGGRHEFIAYIVYIAVFSYDLSSGEVHNIYEPYNGAVIDIHPTEQGILLYEYNSEDSVPETTVFYYVPMHLPFLRLKIAEIDGNSEKKLWP